MQNTKTVPGVLLSGQNIVLESDLPEAEINKELDAALTKALHRKDCSLHGFRSGGGLRVFRLEQKGKLLGYGEHPHALESLSLMIEDLGVLARSYKAVYGKTRPHYLTGSSEPQLNRQYGVLDAWILEGNTLDASIKDQKIEVVLSGYSQYHASPEILERAKLQPEVPVRHENRGCVFETTYHYDPLAGDRYPTGFFTSVVSLPEGMKHHRATMWHSNQTGRADTFFAAMELAFAAPETELPDHE